MQKYATLVELEKCCQTHIFLQTFVLIQPRTSPPKNCKLVGKFANTKLILLTLTAWCADQVRDPRRGAADRPGDLRLRPGLRRGLVQPAEEGLGEGQGEEAPADVRRLGVVRLHFPLAQFSFSLDQLS